MGAFARYPIALAPGMGLNAYFTYAVCKGMGVPWQTALGAVFISGVIFLLLTGAGIRQLILEAIPKELYAAVAVGIGLFIAFIGFRNSGIVATHPSTAVTLGNLRDPNTMLALFGLLLTAGLMARGYPASILLGIVITTVVGALTGLVHWSPQPYSPAELTATLGKLDVAATLQIGLLEIVFVFLFVDMFDNIGTLVAVGKRAGLFSEAGKIPRVNRILTCDATATVIGSLTGTSTVVSYIESAAGVVAGGRTGIPAIVTGLLFLVALFVAPLVGVIPSAATAPALIVVGSLMLAHASEIDWHDAQHAIPAFLTITAIPLTFSIANGLAFGFVSYTLIQLFAGRWRQVNWLVWLLTALFIVRFAYLGQG
jgi:AGZA family xanthine/uracil permease-like MFS transporter